MSTPSPTVNPGPRRNPAPGGWTSPRGRHLNLRAVSILAVLVLVGIPAFFLVKYYQERQRGSTLLAEARDLLDRTPPDPNLALSYLNRYLDVSPPTDPAYLDALDLKGKVLLEHLGNPGLALPIHEQLVRADPEGRHRDARRRLVRLELQAGKYQTARTLAEELSDEAKGEPTAEDYRLLASVLEAQALFGDESAWAGAIAAAERAQRLEPGFVDGARALAHLYWSRQDDRGKAEQVLDALLEQPLSDDDRARARLARYQVFQANGEPARARAELQEAIRLHPGDAEILMIAAEDALRRGDAEASRRHLDDIPAEHRGETLYRIKGLVGASQNQFERAITEWRAGLLATGGTSIDLTWRLAYMLLQLGRVDQAAPLVEQYHRLTDRQEPTPQATFLDALMLLKRDRPDEARTALERLRLTAARVDDNLSGPDREAAVQRAILLQSEVNVALGQCFEALGRDREAVESYREAARSIRSVPALVRPGPWLAAHNVLLRAGRLDEAAAELEDGLATLRNDPALMAALVRLHLTEQARLPQEKRSGTEVERALERGLQAAPADAELIRLKASYLLASGRADEADALLEAAIDPSHEPRSPELWATRAELLRRRGRTEEALEVLDRATAAVGEQALLRLSREQILLTQGHERAALDALAEGARLVPDDQRPVLWQELGNLQRRLNDPTAARQSYARWAELAPDDPQPRMLLLELALDAGDERAADEAIASLEAIGGLSAQQARAAMLMGPQPAEAGSADLEADPARAARLDEAGRIIDRIVAENPSKPVGYMLRGQLQERRGDLDGAAGAYREARERDGGRVVLRALMLTLARARKFDELQRLRAELSPGEMPPDLEQQIAVIALAMGEVDQARQIVGQIVQGDPQGLNTRVWEAAVLNAMNKPEEAEKAFQTLIDQRPRELAPRVALMSFYVNRGRRQEAAGVVDRIRTEVESDRLALALAGCYQAIGEPAKAAESYRQALRERPDDPETARRAVAFFKVNGQADEAIAALREILGRDPGQDWARRELALLLSARAGDLAAWSEALELVGASARAGETPEDRLVRATVLARSADPDRRRQSIGILEALIAGSRGGVTPGAHDLLARVLGDDGQIPEAIRHAEAAATGGTDPNSVAYYIELLIRDKQIDEAERQLERLEGLESQSLRTAGYRALILQARGQALEAAEGLERAVAGLQDGPGAEIAARGVLDLLIRLDQAEAAERVGRELARRWPSDAWALALVLARAGKVDEALEACQTAADAGATTEAALAATQIALAQPDAPGAEGHLTRAEALLATALDRKPDDVLLAARPIVQRALGRHDQAVAAYRSLLGRNPDNTTALNNLAWTLSEDLDRPEEALEPINHAIRLSDRDNPSLLDTRGVILTRLGRLNDAIRDFKAAAAQSGASASTLYHLARAYHKAGNQAEFRDYRERARQAGLTPDQLQPSERTEMNQLME